MVLSELFGLNVFIENSYIRAAVIFLILFLGIWICVWILGKIILKFTKRTKTDLDDILLRRSAGSVIAVAFLLFARIVSRELPLSKMVFENFNKGIYSGLVIAVVYLVYILIDVVLIRGWKKFVGRTKTDLDDNLVHMVQGILKIVLVVLALLYVLSLWGIEILPLIGALGIAGLAVALALQPTLSNIFAGISMVFDRSVRVGDWVVLEDGVWGIVDRIGIRSTKLKTFDNEMLVIPNGKFADSRIQNVSMPEPKARVVIPFGVAYGSDVDKVKKIVEEEIKKIENLDKEEEVKVRFLEMADSALNFKAYFYIESFEKRLNTIDEATSRIYKILQKSGIEIPFPQIDVHVKK